MCIVFFSDLLVVLAAGLLRDRDDGVADNNAHLVVLVAGESASVLVALSKKKL
jgi:hypothetical protein